MFEHKKKIFGRLSFQDTLTVFDQNSLAIGKRWLYIYYKYYLLFYAFNLLEIVKGNRAAISSKNYGALKLLT